MYSAASELAYEFITHAIPHSRPPTITMGRGPNRSTRYPATGASHVSVSTKIENATWIAARVHPNLSESGLTKSVQPYWRFAIIAMHTMPRKSCSQRYEAGRIIGDDAESEV